MPKYNLDTFLDRLTEKMEQLDAEINKMKEERAKQYDKKKQADRYLTSEDAGSKASANIDLLDTRLRDLESFLHHVEAKVESLLKFQASR
ncbi:hypothetical protein BGZ96_005311, partial [Linnemannia gamsii]